MYKKLVTLTLVFLLSSLVLMPTSVSDPGEDPWWDENWPYRQKVNIPFDTSDDYAHFKPIDIPVEFDDSCWGKSKTHHSIRVIYQKGNVFKELESQIYDLDFSDESHINSCNLVFLIPENADGSEVYYIYYDDSEKNPTDYTDHVRVDESYYRCEPFTGLYFESWFYAIYDEDFMVYTVAQKGSILDDFVSQQVMKIKPGVENVLPNSGEQVVSFNLVYWSFKYDEWTYYTSSEKLVKKEIVVDGNLMIKLAIVSQSSDGALKSTVYYKYYYSPNDDKGIFVNAKHEANGNLLPDSDEVDMAYATMNSMKVRSSRIEELNFGSIPGYMHFYSEKNQIVTQQVDQNPEGINWRAVIDKEDDYDLASEPWVSIDSGEEGEAHGIILDSSELVESGEGERDGVELQLYQSNNIKLPGIDGRFSYLYLMRNDYEPGEKFDTVLPEDYVVNYKAEFFSTKTGGYKRVEKEADLYHSFIDYQPTDDEDISNGNEEEEEYDITVYTYLTPSNALKFLESKLLLQNTYIRVELYLNDNIRAYARSSKIAFSNDYWLDWKNTTFFRKAIFPNQKPGFYVIKIFLENTYLTDREFIGYSFFNLTEDKTVKILCKKEATLEFNIYDQDENGVENVEALILNQGTVILKETSDKNGFISTGVPLCLSEGYQFKLLYKGFLLTEDQEIRLGLRNAIFPFRRNFNFSVYDFKVDVKDEQGEHISRDIDVSLTSSSMFDKISIQPDSVSGGVYEFKNLPASDYILSMKYDSIEVKEKISIPEMDSKEIRLYDYVLHLKDSLNLTPVGDIEIVLTRRGVEEDITVTGECISNEECVFSYLYPGDYTLKIFYKTFVLEEKISIPRDNGLEETIVLPFVFNVSTMVYDSSGGALPGAKVVLKRDGVSRHIETDKDGTAVFSIPPGVYNIEVSQGNTLIAKRKIEVINDKSIDIVTSHISLVFIVSLVVLCLFIIIVSIFLIHNKNYRLWLKFFIIFLVLLSVILPWWSINGSSNDTHYETSTNLYLTTSEMVIFTKDGDVYAGEFSNLDDLFVTAINGITILILIGVGCIFFSMLLKYYTNRKRTSMFVLFISILLFITSLTVFVYAMSELSNAIVGGLIGNGEVNFSIPGEDMLLKLPSIWGPSIGFYICLLGAILTMFVLFFEKKKK